MRVLVATATRHGATRNIGSWIAAYLAIELSERGVRATVDLRDAQNVDSIAEYDAVVLGSAVYMGRWLKPARALVAREQSELQAIPVWLFSSGPVGLGGPGPLPSSSWDKAAWAVEHKTFGGKLDRSTLSWFERQVVRLIRADDGDNRSRTDVDAWAASICTVLVRNTAGQSTHTE